MPHRNRIAQTNRRAFTLIELLVVIAIIAILAALLFPVFAQAKEASRKAVTISNTKQTALAMLMYTTDNDDLFPNMYPMINSPEYGEIYYIGWSFQVPGDWLKVDEPWPNKQQDEIWANSIQPFMKSYGTMEVPTVSKSLAWGVDYSSLNKQPQRAPLTANGLLHNYPASSVADPSKLTLVWTGNMREDLYGYARANPQLACFATRSPCRFSPTSEPQPEMAGAGYADFLFPPFDTNFDSAWVVGRGMVFASVDGSARWQPMNPSGAQIFNGKMMTSYRDPSRWYWTPYGRSEPQMFDFHRCRAEGGDIRYLSFFRPDSTFQYEFGSWEEDAKCGF